MNGYRQAMYLINFYIDNTQYDIARGCAEMAQALEVISAKEFDKICKEIEKQEEKK